MEHQKVKVLPAFVDVMYCCK